MLPAATTVTPMGSTSPPALLMAEQIQRNRRAWRGTVAVLTAVQAVIGLLVGLLVALTVGGGGAAIGAGIGAGLAVAVLVANLAPGLGERSALLRSGARPADPDRQPRLYNLTQGLCEQAGLTAPRLYLVDSDAANAFAVGRDPARSAVVVTSGLLELLNRVELEGVIAHELAHIQSGGARLGSAAVVLRALPGPLARLPLGTAPSRLFDADTSAAYLTRYPPGLAGALAKLAAAPPTPGDPGLDHLWLVAPRPDASAAAHPPVAERIASLRDL
jgi:Zn-dependent protease with chaperone function